MFREQPWERRLRAYWTEDGLPEVATGAGFLTLALLLWADAAAPPGWNGVLRYLLVLVIVGMAFWARGVVQWAKWRLTYPRTGYVAYARDSRKVSRLVGLAAALLAVLALTMVAARWREQAFLWGLSGGMAAVFAWLAWRQAWRRGLVYAGVALLASPVALGYPFPWLSGGPFATRGGVHFALVGLALVVGGGWTLAHYVARHPEPVEKEEA